MRLHENKVFLCKCKHCGDTFTNKNTLRRHMNVVHFPDRWEKCVK